MLNIEIEIDRDTFEGFTEKDLNWILRRSASRIRTAVRETTPVDTGAAKRAWTPIKKDEGGYSFGNPFIYAGVLEYGGTKGKQPWPSATNKKTEEFRGRIYSTQAVGGFVRKVDFDAILDKVVQERLKRVFEK
jgi:hypothetical protein